MFSRIKIDTWNLSLPKANLTKPANFSTPKCPTKSKSVTHSNESSRRVLSSGDVHVVSEQSSWFCKCHVFNLNRETRQWKGQGIVKLLQHSGTLHRKENSYRSDNPPLDSIADQCCSVSETDWRWQVREKFMLGRRNACTSQNDFTVTKCKSHQLFLFAQD